MAKLRRFVLASLAASTVAIGSLAVPASASAMDACAARWQIRLAYLSLSDFFYSIGETDFMHYWEGRADGIIDGCRR